MGQNKSQTVMQFFSFLSDCFYDIVFLLFLKSGHSHMFPDRATAHANNAVKNRNIYHPNDVISIVNTVQGLNAEFLDHNAPKPQFFIGWDALMAKYFQPMRGGFTNISSLSLIKVCALRSSEQTHLIVKLGVLLCSLPWRNVKSA